MCISRLIRAFLTRLQLTVQARLLASSRQSLWVGGSEVSNNVSLDVRRGAERAIRADDVSAVV